MEIKDVINLISHLKVYYLNLKNPIHNLKVNFICLAIAKIIQIISDISGNELFFKFSRMVQFAAYIKGENKNVFSHLNN